MKLLKTFTEKDLGISNAGIDKNIKYQKRQAARAVVIDNENNTALLFDAKHNHHKIPGGGVDAGETIEEALHREVKEEAGCEIKIIKEVGQTVEYRNQINLKQTSYCWLAKVKGKKFAPKFEAAELANGFKLEWIKLDKAIKIFKQDKPQKYFGFFMCQRDLLFFLEANKILNKN